MSNDNEEKAQAGNTETVIENIQEVDDYMATRIKEANEHIAVAINHDDNGTITFQSMLMTPITLGKVLADIISEHENAPAVINSMFEQLFTVALEYKNWDLLELIHERSVKVNNNRDSIANKIWMGGAPNEQG